MPSKTRRRRTRRRGAGAGGEGGGFAEQVGGPGGGCRLSAVPTPAGRPPTVLEGALGRSANSAAAAGSRSSRSTGALMYPVPGLRADVVSRAGTGAVGSGTLRRAGAMWFWFRVVRGRGVAGNRLAARVGSAVSECSAAVAFLVDRAELRHRDAGRPRPPGTPHRPPAGRGGVGGCAGRDGRLAQGARRWWSGSGLRWWRRGPVGSGWPSGEVRTVGPPGRRPGRADVVVGPPQGCGIRRAWSAGTCRPW